MKLRSSRSLAALSCSIFMGFAMIGCVADTTEPVEENIADNVTSFDEFKAGLTIDPATGAYIVEGDILIHSEEDLEEYFAQGEQPGALIVHRVNGADSVWSAAQAMNLTYCVSDAFGVNKGAVVQAMASAAASWSSAASVRFVYSSAQDSSCTASNNNVVFNVRPVSGTGYNAAAFFPTYSRAQRELLINWNNSTNSAPKTLTGILTHELGHALGFRHEHIRSGGAGCPTEDSSWRSLTPYDSSSVMHYPPYSWSVCKGTNNGDYHLTQRDKAGAASLYPTTRAASWGWGNVSNFVGNGKALPWIRVAAGASVPMSESFVMDAGSFGCPTCITQIVMGIAGGGKQCVYNGVGYVSSSTSFSLTAPSQKGVYEVWARQQLQYNCADALNLSNDGMPVAYVEVDSCAHDKCTTGGVLASGCDNQCVTDICSVDSYCCTVAWDSLCVSEVNSVCHQGC